MGEKTHRNALTAGYKLHWYIIRSVLGQGGFGITYLAFDSNLQREVAIKEYLPSELVVRDRNSLVQPVSESHVESYSAGLERFIQEAQTLARFKHPNIVPVLAVFEENNTGYMVMNYEHGHSLQQTLSGRNTLAENEVIRILFPILDGLEEVHKAGFIHRDLKPANIFLREDGSPLLLDFGSARYSLGKRTNTLTSMVSPGYAPYEQYHSKGDDQGPWTDIYGMGATLYRAVTGIPPADAISRSKALLDTSSDIYVPAAEICGGNYSKGLLYSIDRALRFKHQDRPQTVSQWRDEFRTGDVVDTISLKISPADQRTRPATIPGTGKSSQRRSTRSYVYLMFLIVIAALLYRYQDIAIDIGTNVMTAAEPDETVTLLNTIDEDKNLIDLTKAKDVVQRESELIGGPVPEEVMPEATIIRVEEQEQMEVQKLKEIESREQALEKQQQLAVKIRQENLEKQQQLALQEQLLEEEHRRIEEKRKTELYQKEIMAVRIEEEQHKQAEIKRTADFNRLLYEAQQSSAEGDFNLSVLKYEKALAIFPDNKEARSGLNRARAVREICSGIIGEWLWFNGGLTVFIEKGIVTGEHRYLGRNKGKWKCSDPALRKFTILWENRSSYDLTLSADKNALNGINREGVRISGKRK